MISKEVNVVGCIDRLWDTIYFMGHWVAFDGSIMKFYPEKFGTYLAFLFLAVNHPQCHLLCASVRPLTCINVQAHVQQTSAVEHVDDFRDDFEFIGWNVQPAIKRCYHRTSDFFARVGCDVSIRFQEHLYWQDIHLVEERMLLLQD